MHTANTGLNQGREVAVLPHSLDNPRGAGNISLVVDGAAGLFTTVEAFIERLPPSGLLPELPSIYQEDERLYLLKHLNRQGLHESAAPVPPRLAEILTHSPVGYSPSNKT